MVKLFTRLIVVGVLTFDSAGGVPTNSCDPPVQAAGPRSVSPTLASATGAALLVGLGDGLGVGLVVGDGVGDGADGEGLGEGDGAGDVATGVGAASFVSPPQPVAKPKALQSSTVRRRKIWCVMYAFPWKVSQGKGAGEAGPIP